MVSICFYFQVHQPFRLRTYPVFDIGNSNYYFDDKKNEDVCRKVAQKCYLPTNRLMKKLIDRHNGKFRIAYSLTGTIIEQLEQFCPEVISSFQELANFVHGMGYKGILAEGADHVLGWRSPNFVYTPKTAEGMKLLMKNYKLSDDIAFRFSDKSWNEHPLTAPKFASWVNMANGSGDLINLFMDYETFGEHQWADKGIFNFLSHLPSEILRHPDNQFVTPS